MENALAIAGAFFIQIKFCIYPKIKISPIIIATIPIDTFKHLSLKLFHSGPNGQLVNPNKSAIVPISINSTPQNSAGS